MHALGEARGAFEGRAGAANSACSLPPCGGGVGRGVVPNRNSQLPLPVPPPHKGVYARLRGLWGEGTLRHCSSSLILFCVALLPAQAQSVADFYRDKTVTLTVSAGAGGGYDTLARTVARFLNKHLPGNPIIVVRNMAGGGGSPPPTRLFSGAEKDGSHIGLLQSQSPFEPLLGAREARFEATRFNWLGTPSVETGLFVLWNAVPVDTLAKRARARSRSELPAPIRRPRSTPGFSTTCSA